MNSIFNYDLKNIKKNIIKPNTNYIDILNASINYLYKTDIIEINNICIQILDNSTILDFIIDLYLHKINLSLDTFHLLSINDEYIYNEDISCSLHTTFLLNLLVQKFDTNELLDIIKLFLSKGGNINIQNKSGKTILFTIFSNIYEEHINSKEKRKIYLDLIEIFIPYIDIFIQNKDGNTYLHILKFQLCSNNNDFTKNYIILYNELLRLFIMNLQINFNICNNTNEPICNFRSYDIVYNNDFTYYKQYIFNLVLLSKKNKKLLLYRGYNNLNSSLNILPIELINEIYTLII